MISGLTDAEGRTFGLFALDIFDETRYTRRESDSYLSFPEWHIVYTYEDLAGVLRQGSESDFAYSSPIAAFWRSFCALNSLVTARGGTGLDTRVSLYTIGWSFTAELAIKGAYENTAGRLFEWIRGSDRTAEDLFARRDMQAYAEFLRQTPWYEYPFGARLAAFWRETPMRGAHVPRKLERRLAFSLEYGVKAIYGALIAYATAATMGTADLEIKTVVVGLDPADVARDPRIRILRELGAGRTLILTPRYQVYTELVVELARRGRDIAEIAGNHRILVTVLAPDRPLPPLAGTRPCSRSRSSRAQTAVGSASTSRSSDWPRRSAGSSTRGPPWTTSTTTDPRLEGAVPAAARRYGRP